MRDGFGVLDVEGGYRRACEACVHVLRANSHMLLTVLQTFMYDPLFDWMITRAQINGQAVRVMDENKGWQGALMALRYVRARVQGHIASQHTPAPTPTSRMSVDGQVHQLINIATNDQLLAKMFYGWCPYL